MVTLKARYASTAAWLLSLVICAFLIWYGQPALCRVPVKSVRTVETCTVLSFLEIRPTHSMPSQGNGKASPQSS
jgi:hypothetical protein